MRVGVLLAAAACAAGFAGTASAAGNGSSAGSSNWAGYAVTGTNAAGGPTTFNVGSASWVQPAAKCTVGSARWSSFWVGLGGIGEGTKTLDQNGTDTDGPSNGDPI